MKDKEYLSTSSHAKINLKKNNSLIIWKFFIPYNKYIIKMNQFYKIDEEIKISEEKEKSS